MNVEKARELSKKLNVLFWVGVIVAVIDLIDSDSIVAAVCGIIYAVLLIMMGKLNGFYRKSGVIVFVSMGVTVIWLIATTAALFAYGIGAAGIYMALLVTIVIVVLTIYGTYCEIKGHSTCLEEVGNPLSETWMTIWKWMLGGYICTGIGAVMLFIVPSLGTMATVVGGLIMLVIGIVKLVYIYKTMAVFRDYSSPVPGFAAGEQQSQDSGETAPSYVYAEPVREPSADTDAGEKGEETDGGNEEKDRQ